MLFIFLLLLVVCNVAQEHCQWVLTDCYWVFIIMVYLIHLQLFPFECFSFL
jgi:hypothetical protein